MAKAGSLDDMLKVENPEETDKVQKHLRVRCAKKPVGRPFLPAFAHQQPPCRRKSKDLEDMMMTMYIDDLKAAYDVRRCALDAVPW